MAKLAAAVCVVCAIGCAAFVGLSPAVAGSKTETFGIGEAQASTTSTVAELVQVGSTAEQSAITESPALSKTTTRNITAGIQAINQKKEAERIAAEEAAKKAEQERIAAAEAAKAAASAAEGLSALSDIDWTVGKSAFISEWSARIDAYLAGSPLAGQGVTFATAAWENGVDPRWSPAISNTESSKGSVCFLPYNAWGWGSSSFSCWEEAIATHVAGLASGYGYTISLAGAMVYCPPNYNNWFNNTLSEMARI